MKRAVCPQCGAAMPRKFQYCTVCGYSRVKKEKPKIRIEETPDTRIVDYRKLDTDEE